MDKYEKMFEAVLGLGPHEAITAMLAHAVLKQRNRVGFRMSSPGPELTGDSVGDYLFMFSLNDDGSMLLSCLPEYNGEPLAVPEDRRDVVAALMAYLQNPMMDCSFCAHSGSGTMDLKKHIRRDPEAMESDELLCMLRNSAMELMAVWSMWWPLFEAAITTDLTASDIMKSRNARMDTATALANRRLEELMKEEEDNKSEEKQDEDNTSKGDGNE